MEEPSVVVKPRDVMPEGARTLPARYYTDPALFKAELDGLFGRMWFHAGRSEEAARAGQYFIRELNGHNIVVTRNTSGRVRAFHNICRHRGTRMCTEAAGQLSGSIQCPYHAWTYDLDGRLIGAPHMDEVPHFHKTDYPLMGVHADEWDGHIFLNLGEGPDALGAQLGALVERFRDWRMQDLRLGRRIVYDVKANWKLIVLNYNECLHCPNLHPALNKLHHYLDAENVAPTACYCGGVMGFRDGVETMSLDGKRRRDVLPGLDERQRQEVVYYAIYPNFLLSLHPDYVMTHTLWPRAHDRSEIICEWHFHPSELAKSDPQIDDAVEFWDITNREDWWIAEQSQLGISSRVYAPGPYSEREELLWSFDEIVRREAARGD
jgi:phenylpropionate dioxygenase-like ring-hydroxylating dioxygenase large terminal subunit